MNDYIVPKHEPEVTNIHRLRIEELLRQLRDAGIQTDLGTFGEDLRQLSYNDQVVTAVAASIMDLTHRTAKDLSAEALVERISDLLELTITVGGVMALKQVADASEKSLASVFAKHGPAPTKLDDAAIHFYTLAKSLEIGYETIQDRRNALGFKLFKTSVEDAIQRKAAKAAQEGPKS